MIFMSYLAMMYDPLCQLTGRELAIRVGRRAPRF